MNNNSSLNDGLFQELEYYIKAIDTMPAGLVIYKPNGQIIQYNKHLNKLFGYTLEDADTIDKWYKLAYPDEKYKTDIKQKWGNEVDKYFVTGTFTPLECIVRCKDGTDKIIELNFEAVGDLYLATIIDITARKKAEEVAKESNWRYKIISDLTYDYIFVVDVEKDESLTFSWASENLERITGRKSEDVGDLKNWMRIIHPDHLEKFTGFIKQVLSTQEPLNVELKSFIKSGQERWINIYAQQHTVTHNGKTSIIGAVKDITEKKTAEQALKESEEKYRSLIENVNEIIYIHDKKGVFTYVSPQVESIFGYKPEDIIGAQWEEIATENPINQKSWETNLRHFDEKSKETMTNIYEIKVADGTCLFLEATERVLFDHNGEVSGIIGSVRNITERKKTEEELDKYHNQLEMLVAKRTQQLEATNKELRSVNEELYNTNEQLKKQTEALNNTLLQLKETQSQLIQSEKMASIGILTAGVAHEINNPLNFIQAGIYKIENLINTNSSEFQNSESKEIFKEALNFINIGINRANGIVKSLNLFSRKSDDVMQACNIHDIIDNCLIILHHEISNKCEIVKDYSINDLIIPGIEGKLQQVFMNILLNAVQAIEKGTITISTSMDSSEHFALIKIKDTGKGIHPDHINKIFDPFFTTKDPGQGTGLGLSIVYSIIQEHNGTIVFNSNINEGTEVIVELPGKVF